MRAQLRSLLGWFLVICAEGTSNTSVTNLRFTDTDTAKFHIGGLIEWDPPVREDQVTQYAVYIAFDEQNSFGVNLWYQWGDGVDDFAKYMPVGTNQFSIYGDTIRQTKKLNDPDYPANWLLVLSESNSVWQSADEAAKMVLHDVCDCLPDMVGLSVDTSGVRETESRLVGTIQWTPEATADLGFTRSFQLYLEHDTTAVFPMNNIGEVPVGTNEFALDVAKSCEDVRYVRIFARNDKSRSETGKSEALQACFPITSTTGTNTSTTTRTTTWTTTTLTASSTTTLTNTTSTATSTATNTTTNTATTETTTTESATTKTITTATETATSRTPTVTMTNVSSTTTSTSTNTASNTTTATATTTAVTTTTPTATTNSSSTSTITTVALDGPGWFAAVQESEDAVAVELASGNLPTLTRWTPAATIVAHKIEPAALEVGGSTLVSVPSSSVLVTVPHSVLAAVGGEVILSVAAFQPGSVGSFEAPAVGATLGSVPVSIRIRSADAALVDATFPSDLPEPITVQLTATHLEDAHCAYFDVAEQRWSSQGVESTASEGGGFVCSVAHLTVFAAILGDFERVFLCSNVFVFTADGLRAMGRGGWSRGAPAVFLWFFLVVQLLMLSWAVYSDFRAYRTALWRDADFLTDNKAFEGRDDSCTGYLCDYFLRYLPRGGAVERQGRLAALVESVCVTIAADAAHYEVARQANIVPIDMKDLILCTAAPPTSCACGAVYRQGSESCWKCGAPRQDIRTPLSPAGNLNSPSTMAKALSGAVSRTVRGLEAKVRRKVPSIMNRFVASGFCALAWSTFAALHPWAQLGQYSTTFGASIRSLLLTAKLLGALTISALFFDASGNATGLGSAPDCDVFNAGTIVARGILVGACSIFLSVVPVLLISCCSNRRFIFRDSWEDSLKRGYVLCWRSQDIVMISLAVLYSTVCLVCVMAFLANLSPGSQAEYLVSVVFVLAREFVLMPLALALLYSAVATVIIRTQPQLSERVKERLDMELGLTASSLAPEESTCCGGGLSTEPCPEEDEAVGLELTPARLRRRDLQRVASDVETVDRVASDVGAPANGQAAAEGLVAALDAMAREDGAGPAAPSSQVRAPERASTPLEPSGTGLLSMSLTGASMDLPGVPDSEAMQQANVREGEC